MSSSPSAAERFVLLQQHLSSLRDDLQRYEHEESHPSFRRQLIELRQTISYLNDADPERQHPYRKLINKLAVYDFAASHNVEHPEVFSIWDHAAQVDPASLPDEFVLKSSGGSTGHGVIPLRRISRDSYRIVSKGEAVTASDIRDRLSKSRRQGRTYGKFFAERLLHHSEPDRIPLDIKFYCCYGDVLQVLVREVTWQEGKEVWLHRYFSPDGEDLGFAPNDKVRNQDIPLPDNFTDLTQTASHLSWSSGLPFCRVDLYSIDGRAVIGEITRTPGGTQQYPDHHDAAMGRKWMQALIRRDLDLMNGRPPGMLYGTSTQGRISADEAGSPSPHLPVGCRRCETAATTNGT